MSFLKFRFCGPINLPIRSNIFLVAGRRQGEAVRNIGRFIVSDLLGTGTQGKVYRCRDPKLQREVAIKLLHRPLLQGAGASEELLREARAMSRLNHQNIVSVFDVGEQKGRPYLVFELIEGQTLAALLKKDAPDMAMGLAILDGVVQGIAQAHEEGIVHRDIKPANIILTRTGIPKITDFGIAAVLRGGRERQSRLVGTPRYMAPEYIEKGQVMKQTDVFALGLVAWEILTGRPAYEGGNAEKLLRDIVQRPVQPLDQILPDIDERLQRIIEKALEKDPFLRFADAGEMHEALQEYREASQTVQASGHSHATIQFLLRRMRLKNDFPALAQSISTLNRLADSSDKDSTQLANIIVKDQGLSSKILRVVNSAYYGAFSGTIGTISRAVVILGVNGVRSIAASLSLLEHFGDRSNVGHIKDMLSESLYSGLCAREICKGVDRDLAEEALLGTMLRRLGGILVAYYLPDEEQEIRRLQEVDGLEALEAERQVLGTDYARIGREVAREWNFPVDIRACLEDPGELPRKRVQDRSGRLRLLAHLADEATVTLRQGRSERSLAKMKRLVSDYARVLGVEPLDIVDSIGSAKQEYMDFKVNFVSDKEKVRFVQSLDEEAVGAQDRTQVVVPAGDQGALTVSVSDTGTIHTRVAGVLDREQMLSEGLQEVTRMLVGTYRRSELIDVVLEILYRGMGFKRIIAAEWNAHTSELVAVAGVGDEVEELQRNFRLRCKGRPNLLTIAHMQNSDVYIKDATKGGVREKMPPWFDRVKAPGSFFVLPMRTPAGPVGMLYAEYPLAYGFDENPNVLQLLQALRNQLTLGLGQLELAAVAR